MTTPSTGVPVSFSNGGHGFEIETFDAERAANDGLRFRHEGRVGGPQLTFLIRCLSYGHKSYHEKITDRTVQSRRPANLRPDGGG